MNKGMSRSEAGKLGAEKVSVIIKEKFKKRVEKYNQNPKLCKHCGKPINYDKRNNKFCNHSCSASYNNLGVCRNEKKDRGNCHNCSKLLVNGQKKYCSSACQQHKQHKNYIEKWLAGEVDGTADAGKGMSVSKHIRTYILRKFDNCCAVCGLREWLDKPIVFILDHIDGNCLNNNEDNLRIICPNCDSQLDTYKGKNRGNGRHERMKRYTKGKSF